MYDVAACVRCKEEVVGEVGDDLSEGWRGFAWLVAH